MSKICNNRECIRCINKTELGDAENYCPECGNTLSKKESSQPAGTGKFNLDNRLNYHDGDRTDIAGDNIGTQNVDNSVTTNTSNVDNSVTTTTTSNVVTNITTIQVKDETFECEISGKTVSIKEKVRCLECRRNISREYYDNKELLCKKCVEKKKQQPVNPVQEKIIPPLVAGGEQRPGGAVAERIGPGDPPKGSNKWVFGLLFLLVVGGIGYFLFPTNKDSQLAAVPPATTEAAQTPTPEPAPAAKAENPAPAKPAPKASEPAKPAATEKAEAPAVAKVSTFNQGEEAYQAGNFSKANLLFTQAAQEGNSKANYYLAKMYQEGKGVSKSIKKGYEFMIKAAEGGCEDAYYEVAEMLRTGKGTESNRNKAKGWYEKAALSNKNSDKASQALSKYY